LPRAAWLRALVRVAGVLGVGLVLLLGSSRAHAAQQTVELPAPPPAGERPETFVERATQAFQSGQYVEAADNLYRAYQLSPKPIYLFNAGQSYRKGGRADQALAMYDRFVRAAPEHSLANEARAYMATLEALIKEQRSAKDTELKLLNELEQQKEINKETERKLKEAGKVPVYKRGWFGAVVGITGALVGLAAITTGVVLGVYLHTDGPQVAVKF
jgi:tetratricopeptide (TPR) repeat protein